MYTSEFRSRNLDAGIQIPPNVDRIIWPLDGSLHICSSKKLFRCDQNVTFATVNVLCLSKNLFYTSRKKSPSPSFTRLFQPRHRKWRRLRLFKTLYDFSVTKCGL